MGLQSSSRELRACRPRSTVLKRQDKEIQMTRLANLGREITQCLSGNTELEQERRKRSFIIHFRLSSLMVVLALLALVGPLYQGVPAWTVLAKLCLFHHLD